MGAAPPPSRKTRLVPAAETACTRGVQKADCASVKNKRNAIAEPITIDGSASRMLPPLISTSVSSPTTRTIGIAPSMLNALNAMLKPIVWKTIGCGRSRSSVNAPS